MKKTTALFTAVALSGLLAACSGGESEPAETAATEEPAPVVEEAPVEAPAGDTAAAPAGGTGTKDGIAFASLTGDAAAGKVVFAQCRSCHTTEAGVNKTGPSLHQVVGRQAGSVAGFNYSPANANSGKTWTEDELYVYLEDPRAAIPNTKMIFPGLRQAQDRANVIAYLKNPT